MTDQTDNRLYLGLDIGGTKCSVIAGDGNFKIKEKISFKTLTKRGYKVILDEFGEKIDSILNKFPEHSFTRFGISCGGPLDSARGVIYSPPNLPGWDEVPITEIFEKRYGIPAFLQNDANACALAEWMMGAGKGTSNMVFLTFGTGMGAGLIINGKLYSGTNDMAGEVGHIRLAKSGPVGYGKAGSFEGFCSGGGIAQLARSVVTDRLKKNLNVGFCPSVSIVEKIDTKMVALAAQDGDPVAKSIIKRSAEYLGRGLSVLVDVLNPECIVIGSIYERNENLFKPVIERILKKEALPGSVKVCNIKPAALGDSIGDYASLCVAIYQDKF